METLGLYIYGEICCDICGDIARNYIDCPSCGEEYARTDYVGDITEETGIACSNCRADFKTIDGSHLKYFVTNKVYKTN